jgi:hypothetical protein
MWPIIVYGVLGFLAWSANGPVGALVVLVVAGAIHTWMLRDPPSVNTDNRGVINPDSPRSPDELGIGSKIGNFIGAAFGLLILAGIGLGIVSAIFSPGSCSNGGFEQEYRAP